MDIIRIAGIPWLEMKINRDEPDYSRRRHSHAELSFGIIDQGITTIEIGKRRCGLHQGDGIFIPAETIHLCLPRQEEIFSYRMFYFDTDWFGEAFSLPEGPPEPAAGSLPPDLYKQSLALSGKLTDEENPPDPFEIESTTLSLLGSLAGHLDTFPLLPPDGSAAELETVKDAMDRNYKEQLTLDDLAAAAGMNKYSFLRTFKKQYNISPHAYLVNKRIEYCRKCLKEGKNEMADMALEAGFTDQSHFIKTFRQYVGMLPGEYR